MFMIRNLNVYTWYKHVYTFTSLYIHVYDMYIQTRKCIDMFMAGLSPSMRQTLLKHVYALYIHVYVIWSGFQMQALQSRWKGRGWPRSQSGKGKIKSGVKKEYFYTFKL